MSVVLLAPDSLHQRLTQYYLFHRTHSPPPTNYSQEEPPSLDPTTFKTMYTFTVHGTIRYVIELLTLVLPEVTTLKTLSN